MRELILLGASGLAREVIGMSQSQYRVVGILDDDPGLQGVTVGGVEVIGRLGHAAEHDAALLLCVGSGAARRAIASRLADLGVGDERFAVLADSSVSVPPSATVGPGSILLAHTALTADIVIGRHVVVMPNCTITHDDVLEDFVTLAAGVALGGGVRVGEAAYIGMNASVRQRTSIGAAATVGMGAVVLDEVPRGETWVGVPARAMGVRR
ncbi:NeuD/PglB/VioB family sugar acetyltransferase [Leifsonia sp. 2MCAF36]|uniref:NeuD/PglB/VioB family sugar acetyltransferase n=1 Tax=Leifsonia sp. 2MCAF36 TaxID=3232988 RepID=UPI003F973B38